MSIISGPREIRLVTIVYGNADAGIVGRCRDGVQALVPPSNCTDHVG